MPKIETNRGVIKYKTRPIFLGVKKIDKEQATENLLLLKEVLDKKNLKFGLIAGTLLGAVREKDFIEHDEDIDIFFMQEDKELLMDSLHDLIAVGFEIARYDGSELMSIIRKGEYIDLYIFHKDIENVRNCSGWCVPEYFLTETTLLEFKGAMFVVPKEYEEFLIYEYGENWKTPIQYVSFDMSPLKRKLLESKEYIKEHMPRALYNMIAGRKAKQRREFDLKRIENYEKKRKERIK